MFLPVLGGASLLARGQQLTYSSFQTLGFLKVSITRVAISTSLSSCQDLKPLWLPIAELFDLYVGKGMAVLCVGCWAASLAPNPLEQPFCSSWL